MHSAQLADQITDFRAHLGPCPTARSPAPVEQEALTMPLDHCCRFEQHHGVEDRRPNPVKSTPTGEGLWRRAEPTWVLPPQDTHLMSKGNNPDFQQGTPPTPEPPVQNNAGKTR